MSKRILLITGVLISIAAIAVTVGVYQRYLTPNRLIPAVRNAIEDALGQPIELQEARVTGVGTVSFGPITIPSTENTDAEEAWFSAQSATVRLELAKLIAGRGLSLEVELEDPEFNLQDDPGLGWNFLRGKRSESDRSGSSEGKEEGSEFRARSNLELSLRMRRPLFRISDPDRGSCRIQFEDEAQFGFRSDRKTDLKSIRAMGKGRLEGETPSISGLRAPLIVGDLVTAVGTSVDFKIGLEASLRGGVWEIASRQNPGVILDSTASGLSLSRFRIAGRKEADGSFSLDTATVESATLQTANWNHPAIERLEVPWTEPPRGSFQLGIRDFRFEKENLQCLLSGIHIDETTLSIEALPWLKVLTPKEGWGLSDVDLSGALTYSISDGSIRWDSGKIEFQSGDGGRIETSGTFKREPQTEWSVKAAVFDYPVPVGRAGEIEVAPGVFSGDMKWLESIPISSAPIFLAEGSVQLLDGEIGAIRLFGGLEDLLKDEGILKSPFSRFGFTFDLKGERIGISDLVLESGVLGLSGNGSYGPGHRLEMDLEIRPTAELAKKMKEGKSSLVASGVAESKDPLKVHATGDLENPEYSITFGEGMKIPIKGLDVQF